MRYAGASPECGAIRDRLLLVLLLIAVLPAALVHAASCNVLPAHTPSAAERAYLKGQYEQAAALYRADLVQAHDPDQKAELTAGLSRTLLREVKLAEANTAVEQALAENPHSAVLLVALGEVQYRMGTPWLASKSADAALQIDPCYPRTHLLYARLLRINSAYKSGAAQVAVAHQLDPHDAAIRRLWMDTLPLRQRASELEAFLASDTGEDPETLLHLHEYLDALEKTAAAPRRTCRLVSDTTTAEVPFASIMRDATHLRAYGLEVKLNGHAARLQIDTGADGLLISRSAAERAGLERFSNTSFGGIGDKGDKEGYTAYADSIHIGALEFHDCQVRVVDSRNILETDGLIGPDVFSRFLVTLDYPMRKLVLGPLPKRPEDVEAAKPALETGSDPSEESPAPEQPKAAAAGAVEKPALPARSSLHDRYVAPEMQDWTRVYRVGHNLIVPTTLNDHGPKLFILDTGAFTTSVVPEVAKEVTKVHSDERMRIHGLSGAVEKVYAADHIEFKFGNMRQDGTDVTSFDMPQVSHGNGMEIAGFLGIRTLGQLTLSIDYRDALVHFAFDPNRGYRYTPY